MKEIKDEPASPMDVSESLVDNVIASESILNTRTTRSGEKVFANVTPSPNVPTVMKEVSFKSKKKSGSSNQLMQSLLSGKFINSSPNKAPVLIKNRSVGTISDSDSENSNKAAAAPTEKKTVRPKRAVTTQPKSSQLDYLLSQQARVVSFPAAICSSFPHWIEVDGLLKKYSEKSISDEELMNWEPADTLRLVAQPIFTRNMETLFSLEKERLMEETKLIDDSVTQLQNENLSLCLKS